MVKGEHDFLNFRKTSDFWKFSEQGFPEVDAVKLKPDAKLEIVPFHEAHRVQKNQRKSKIVHFFLADYLFERVWNQPNKAVEFLSDFKAVFTPDFSMYTDMPRPLQIYNAYRRMWTTKYFQDARLRVIPVACWSDENSYDFCFEGMPKNALIAVSTVGCAQNPQAKELFKQGYAEMKKQLTPSQIILYGKKPAWLEDDVVEIEPDYEKRFRK